MENRTTPASAPETDPWPGEALAERVAGRVGPEGFAQQGRLALDDLARMVAVAGRRLEDVERVLDFGCGSGRLLAHLPGRLPQAEVWGADVDAEAVAWCSEHLPGVRAITCASLPPLDAPSGHFDLVVANSVFTHLDESYQDAWLDELLRVTRPGATLALSVHGEYALRQLEEPHRAAGTPGVERWRRELDTRGIFFWHDDGLDPEVFPAYYHTTFHAVWYLYAHWGARFEILAHVPRGLLDHQDYLVLRHPTAERPALPVPAPHVTPSADELERLLEGPEASAGAGLLRQAYRRAVLRAVRHPLVHQQLVNRALGGVAREALRSSARAESLAREALREARRGGGSADAG